MSEQPGRPAYERDDRVAADPGGEDHGWGSPLPAEYGALTSVRSGGRDNTNGDDPDADGAEEDKWAVTGLLRRLQAGGAAAVTGSNGPDSRVRVRRVEPGPAPAPAPSVGEAPPSASPLPEPFNGSASNGPGVLSDPAGPVPARRPRPRPRARTNGQGEAPAGATAAAARAGADEAAVAAGALEDQRAAGTFAAGSAPAGLDARGLDAPGLDAPAFDASGFGAPVARRTRALPGIEPATGRYQTADPVTAAVPLIGADGEEGSELPRTPLPESRRRRRADRRPVRIRARATVRHVSVWTVFKVSLMFYLVILAAFVVASVFLWMAADAFGTLPSIEKSVRTLFSLKTFTLHVGTVATYTAAVGVVISVAGTLANVLLSLIYNLIADVIGGIRVDLESVTRD